MTAYTAQPQKVEMGIANPTAVTTTMALPPSVSYLASLDQIIVKQKKEMLEILTGFETCNRYRILNTMNQEIFFAQEESSCMERACFPMTRGFVLHITDNNSQEVIRITREFKICTGCCWCADGCCSMEVVVEAPVGRLVGRVRQRNSKCAPHFSVHDDQDKHLFTIWGPNCPCQTCCCTDDIELPITDPSLTQRIGTIAKQWRGCCQEMITDADQFSLTFPADMAIDTKCLLIGALFIVDYLVFEQENNNNS